MKIFFSCFLSILSLCAFSQECEELTIEQEVLITENIALVQTSSIIGDSIHVQVIKKWKGDSVASSFWFKRESVTSKYLRLDSNQVYVLFWYNGLPIDRCSRSAKYKYIHFEYQLDKLYSGAVVTNVLAYDSIIYRRENIFIAQSGEEFDQSKGEYAFYDAEEGVLKDYNELPKETSYFYPVRFYIVDRNIETARKKYEVVFVVSKSHQELIIDNELKKTVLLGVYD